MVCGLGIVSYVQLGVPEPARLSAILEPGQTVNLESAMSGPDTAFMKITLDALGASANVTVLSPTGSELYTKLLSTKQTVDYFEIERDGIYTLDVMLVSAQPSLISLETGQSLSYETMYPAIVLLAGIVIIIISLCVMLTRYITAQPDENTL